MAKGGSPAEGKRIVALLTGALSSFRLPTATLDWMRRLEPPLWVEECEKACPRHLHMCMSACADVHIHVASLKGMLRAS